MNTFKSVIILYLIVSILSTGCAQKEDVIKQQNEFAIRSAQMGLWNEAIMRWKRILEVEPNNAKILNNLGVAYEAKGDLDSAISAYKSAVELEPNNKVFMSNYIKCKERYDKIKGK